MELDQITKPELLHFIHDKNASFILWLELLEDDDCGHVSWENAEKAKGLIKGLKEQNRTIMAYLTTLAKQNLIPKEGEAKS